MHEPKYTSVLLSETGKNTGYFSKLTSDRKIVETV